MGSMATRWPTEHINKSTWLYTASVTHRNQAMQADDTHVHTSTLRATGGAMSCPRRRQYACRTYETLDKNDTWAGRRKIEHMYANTRGRR